MSRLKEITKTLDSLKDETKGTFLQRYFKTGEGEYGHGDIFLGLSVPEQRKIARRFTDLSLEDIGEMLKSKVHEHRFTALEVLLHKYKLSDSKEKKRIASFYLRNRKY